MNIMHPVTEMKETTCERVKQNFLTMLEQTTYDQRTDTAKEPGWKPGT